MTRPIGISVPHRRVEEDDDIQDYKKPWVGLNNDDWIRIYNHADKSVGRAVELAEKILKEKNT